jgi:preprotein translocase subunit SecY
MNDRRRWRRQKDDRGTDVAKGGFLNPAAALSEATRFADLRQRFLFLIGALVVYRIGTFIPVPGIDPQALERFFQQQEGTILSMFNMFSGGALERMSIFALGIMPYISASIILQMATVVVPTLNLIKKEGESGRRKIMQWTRYGTVALAGFQSIGAAVAMQNQGLVISPGLNFVFTAAVTLVTGTIFLMWLGEQITERGIGNGISMIILASIVSGLPSAIGGSLELVNTGEMSPVLALVLSWCSPSLLPWCSWKGGNGALPCITPSASRGAACMRVNPHTCRSRSTCRGSSRRFLPPVSSCSL